MACLTNFVNTRYNNKNIMGDLSHEEYIKMMKAHVNETLKREYRLRHYADTIAPLKELFNSLRVKQLVPNLDRCEFIFKDASKDSLEVKSAIPFKDLKYFTDIFLIDSLNWIRVVTSPIHDGVVIMSYFHGLSKDAVAIKDEYINFKIARSIDAFQLTVVNFLLTGEFESKARVH